MSELDIPAASAAFLMSGASNSTYRVELVVSGRIAAIFPCPAATNGLSAAIAVKSFVNCVVEMVGVDELVELDVVVVLVVELDDDELPHPAATSAIADVSTMAPNQRVLKLHAPRYRRHVRHRLDSLIAGLSPSAVTVADHGSIVQPS